MYNFNYEYMTFLYVVHVCMFCNVVLYCIALPARVLFAIKIIIITNVLFKKKKSKILQILQLAISQLICNIHVCTSIINKCF